MLCKKLFEPIIIKGLEIRNRIIMPPMHTNQGSMEEGINDDAIDFYISRAKGGFGMVGVGVIDTYYIEGASSDRALFLMNDHHVQRYRMLTKAVKKEGAKIHGQIGVRRVFKVSDLHRYPKLSVLTDEEIQKMIVSMIDAGVRIREAGFNALEILGIGGGAVSLFLSNVFNDRKDQWGGNLDNRLKFPTEILKGIRKKLGNDYPIFFRFHGSEFMPGGYSYDTERVIAQHLQAEGVDLFNVSGGGHGTNVPGMTPTMPRGGFAFLAREIKSAVDTPVAASNRINHPFVAEEILRKGWADMISVGRGTLADADWANKARRGDFEEIRLCIACNECLDSVVIFEQPIRCTVNPKVGRVTESEPLPKASKAKKVLVVGGGVTGMQAAITCAERGHEVYLIEQNSYLGGKWRLAAVPPGREELIGFLHWLLRQIMKAGVDIRIETEFSPQVVKELAPDAIIISTGSSQPMLDIPGVHLPHVAMAEEVLEGNVDVGEKVVVIGGGGVGTGTALYLARRWSCSPDMIDFLIDFDALPRKDALSLSKSGHAVTIIEQLPRIGEGIGPGTKWVIKKELELAGVQSIVKARAKEIKSHQVIVDHEGKDKILEADTVVLATGFMPDRRIYECAKGVAPEVYIAGMATKTGHTIEGIGDAFEVAMKI